MARFVSVLLLAMFSIGPFASDVEAGNPFRDPLKSARNKLSRLSDELGRLGRKLDAAKNELSDARSHLKKLDRAYDNANSAFTKAKNQLSKLESAYKAAKKAYEKLKATAAENANRIPQLREELVAAREGVSAAASKIRALEKEAANIVEQIASFLDQEIIAYDFASRLVGVVHIPSGCVTVDGQIIDGFRIDSKKLEALFKGNFTIPVDVNPLAVISNGGLIKVSLSDEYLSHRPGGRQYYSSRSFVEYMSPETVANEAVAAVLTGGASAQASADLFKEKLLCELNAIAEYLRYSGTADLEAILPQILVALVEGESFSTDELQVTASSVIVPYNYSVSLHSLPKPIEQLIPKLTENLGSVTLNHMGFVVDAGHSGIISKTVVEDRLQSLLTEVHAPIDLEAIILDAANVSPAVARLFSSGAYASPAMNSPVIADMMSRPLRKLAVKGLAQLSQYPRNGFRIDLSESPVADRLMSAVSQITLGNEGQGKLSQLELDLASGTIEFEVSLCHRHSWGTLTEAIASIGAAAQNISPSDLLSGSAAAQVKSLLQKNGQLESAAKAAESILAEAKNAAESVKVHLKKIEVEAKKLGAEVSTARTRFNDGVDEFNSHLTKTYRPAASRLSKAADDFNKYLSDRVRPLEKNAEAARKAYNRMIDRVNAQRNEVNRLVDKFNNWIRSLSSFPKIKVGGIKLF